MPTNVADLRREYARERLDRAAVAADPIEQFTHWFEQAVEVSDGGEPNVVTLATATPDGRPSARMVLLKGFDVEGFRFFTNYESRKSAELDANPQAALVCWWPELERQVRVEGGVVRLGEEASDAYFVRRPRESQLGAWVSPQSRVVESRAVLEAAVADVASRYEGRPVERPPHWGGYLLRPDVVEFWQGRPGRLHDRLRYRRSEPEEGWTVERLAP